MIIGVPKEIMDNEYRTAITPAGVALLRINGHRVLIEHNAGAGSGFSDADYAAEGAEIVSEAAKVWTSADMIMKVKDPTPEEYGYLRENLILFTYLHLAASKRLTQELLNKGVTAIGYETVQMPNRSLPLLMPMSEVAGRMAVQIGTRYLEAYNGGMGVLLGGVPGVPSADVVILGGGIVGTNAAKTAVGLGANVTVIEMNTERMRYLDDVFGARVNTLMSNPFNIGRSVLQADLLIGAVLVPGARTPQLVSEEMVAGMKKGAVIVDVAVDQGGSIATIDRVTTHSQPTYVKHGVIHYAVSNMPGAVPRTSTFALTNATLPYVLELANKGFVAAANENAALLAGVNTHRGEVTHEGVAIATGLPYKQLISGEFM